MLGRVRFSRFTGEQFTVLLESVLDDLYGESLVYPGLTRVTLETTSVRFPFIDVSLEVREPALVDQPFLVLLGCMSSSPDRLLVDVVLWVFVDLLQPCCSLFVGPEMILVQGSLPGFCMFVVDGVPSEVWLIAWCIRGPLIFVDVQRSDAAKELFVKTPSQVLEALPFPWAGPSLPNRADLDDHIDRSEDMLG